MAAADSLETDIAPPVLMETKAKAHKETQHDANVALLQDVVLLYMISLLLFW